ncbi:MAG: hypothetical protein K0U74_10130 [Alphaproteobacteria bacterium]|nr:hypothetical protein [Alphaproteobacteria bacterium]
MRYLSIVAMLAIFRFTGEPSIAVAAIQVTIEKNRTLTDVRNISDTIECNISVKGKIGSGDHLKIRDAINRFERLPVRFSDGTIGYWKDMQGGPDAAEWPSVCLDIPAGGSFIEGLRIARELRRHFVTVVPNGAVCFSACAIAFMGGGRRDGIFSEYEHVPGRYLHIGGRLGFHSPELALPKGQSYTSANVVSAYASALRSISLLLKKDLLSDEEKYESYLNSIDPDVSSNDELPIERGMSGEQYGSIYSFTPDQRDEFVPPGLVLSLLQTPPSGALWINSVIDAIDAGVSLYGLPPLKKSSVDYALVGCANLYGLHCAHGACGAAAQDTPIPLFSLNSRGKVPKSLRSQLGLQISKMINVKHHEVFGAHVALEITTDYNDQPMCRLAVADRAVYIATRFDPWFSEFSMSKSTEERSNYARRIDAWKLIPLSTKLLALKSFEW